MQIRLLHTLRNYKKEYHLTYSRQNREGYPKYIEFSGIQAVKEYIEKEYVREYI